GSGRRSAKQPHNARGAPDGSFGTQAGTPKLTAGFAARRATSGGWTSRIVGLGGDDERMFDLAVGERLDGGCRHTRVAAHADEGRAMTVCRTLLLAALIFATPLCASAQIGGGQGELPGGPWTWPPARPPGPPPACQQLMSLRDETQKHGMAIQK